MEYLKVAGGKASPKREFRSARSRQQRSMMSNLMDAITQVNAGDVVSETKEDGVVRMKIMVRKQDLRQMLEVMKGGGKSNAQRPAYTYSPNSSSLSIEQRLNLLRRKHVLRANSAKESRKSSWSPMLQSIPEEAVN